MAPPIVIYQKRNLPGFIATSVILTGLKRVNPVIVAWESGDALPDTRDRALILIEPNKEFISTAEHSLHVAILHTRPSTMGLDLNRVPNICHINIDKNSTPVKLAWMHVFMNFPIPPFIKAIEDQILGINKIPGSRDLLTLIKKDITVQNEDCAAFTDKFGIYFNGDQNEDIGPLIMKSKMLGEMAQAFAVDIAKRNTRQILMDGHVVPIVNAPSEFSEAVAQLLIKDVPFVVTYEEQLSSNRRVFMLYSEIGKVDVGVLARKCKGSGSESFATFNGDLNISISGMTF